MTKILVAESASSPTKSDFGRQKLSFLATKKQLVAKSIEFFSRQKT